MGTYRPLGLRSTTWAAVALALAAVGCSSTRGIPRAAPSAKPYFITINESGDYVIQHGDVLTVAFFNNPELNEEVIVRPDGKITLQLVGDQEAAGLSPRELDERLTQAYSAELIQPDLSVIVRQFARHQIWVGGEVRAPGLQALEVGMTALNAVFGAGGFGDNARQTEVVIIRRGPDAKPYGWKVNLKKILYSADMSQDVVLQPYDVIFVPKEKIVQFNEFINKYIVGILPFRPYFQVTIDDVQDLFDGDEDTNGTNIPPGEQ